MLTMPFFSEAVSHGPEFFSLAPWIVLFPLIGLLINLIIGGRLPEKVVGTIASTASGAKPAVRRRRLSVRCPAPIPTSSLPPDPVE